MDTMEQEEQKRKREEEYARYSAQNRLIESLKIFMGTLQADKEAAEELLNWVNADKWRDSTMKSLEGRMQRLEEQGKRMDELFNQEVRQMRTRLSNHLYDDFDWTTEFSRVKNSLFNLIGRFQELEKDYNNITKVLALGGINRES